MTSRPLFADLHAPSAPEELLALLTLRFTPGLGPRRTESLRVHFGSAHAALRAPRSELRGVPGLDTRSLAAIGTPKAAEQAQAELEEAARLGVTLLGRGLDGYPPALDALEDAPAVLWVLGDLPDLPVVPRAIGIVGTRAASPHAVSLTRTVPVTALPERDSRRTSALAAGPCRPVQPVVAMAMAATMSGRLVRMAYSGR